METKLPKRHIKLQVKLLKLWHCPNFIHPVDKVLEIHIDFVLSLPFTLLLFNLIRIIGRFSPPSEGLDHIHHFNVELHILGLLVTHHNVIMKVKVKKGNHLIFRRLEECMFDIAKHNINTLIWSRRRIPEPIHMSLQSTRQLSSPTAKSRTNPQVWQSYWLRSVHCNYEFLLSNQGCSFSPLRLPCSDLTPQCLYLRNHLIHMPRIF
uniref:Uncharacterized protein n=1 Tax=Opuntia streptacantha TaxID=393608 RepID=A0A7C9E913_OPUST